MTNPKEWGPTMWTSLLYIVLNYPDAPTFDAKNDYKNFFTNLGNVLPCMECRKNYCDHLKVIPIDMYLDGQPALLNWLWQVHNQVNDFCGKERISLEAFLTKYLKSGDKKRMPTLVAEQTGGSKVLVDCGCNQRLLLILCLTLVILYLLYNQRH